LYQTDDEGKYAIPGLPGRGIVGVKVFDWQRYPRGAGAEEIQGDDRSSDALIFRAHPDDCVPANFHAVAEVNPAPGAESYEQDFSLDPGQTLEGTVLDPDGKPLSGARISGSKGYEHWEPLDSSRFTVEIYDPHEPRTLLFMHNERKLAGGRVLEGAQQSPLTVRLEPWGAIRGRVVDDDGKPVRGAKLITYLDQIRWMTGEGVTRAGLLPERRTDGDGRFHIEGLAPTIPYNVAVRGQHTSLRGQVVFDLTVEPGQTKNLGDLPVKAVVRR
jgi:hypothetical protein